MKSWQDIKAALTEYRELREMCVEQANHLRQIRQENVALKVELGNARRGLMEWARVHDSDTVHLASMRSTIDQRDAQIRDLKLEVLRLSGPT